MNTTHIYIIRHGQSEANLKNIYIGHTDYDLTPRGIIKYLHLLDVDLRDTSYGGHFGKDWLPWEIDDEEAEEIYGGAE